MTRPPTHKESQGATPNPVQVQKFPGGLDDPVGKQEILDEARREGADRLVMETLEQLPAQQYDSPVAVSREVGKLH